MSAAAAATAAVARAANRGAGMAALPLPIGRAPLPEGAWLRLVAQLDWPSCCALTSAGGEAHMGTVAALRTLGQARCRAEAQYNEVISNIEAEAQATATRAQAERNAAAQALAHLEPLRNGRLTERFGPQLQQIFAELENGLPAAATAREADAVAARQAREAEASAARHALEVEARGHIMEGELRVA